MADSNGSGKNIKPTVLVVEDDEAIISLLMYNLEKNNYNVLVSKDGAEGLDAAKDLHPDVILLDWMLPGMSGIDVCNSLRKNPTTENIPIIMISARGEEVDRISGLERGADDYLVKPFSPRELMARINAVFRRSRPVFTSKELAFDGIIKMDTTTHQVTCDDKPVKLGPTEYRLLQAFLEHPRRVLTRDQLMRRVWGSDLHVEARTVDVHINRLRNSLHLNDSSKVVIQTIRSVGYSLKGSMDDVSKLQAVADSEVPDLKDTDDAE